MQLTSFTATLERLNIEATSLRSVAVQVCPGIPAEGIHPCPCKGNALVPGQWTSLVLSKVPELRREKGRGFRTGTRVLCYPCKTQLPECLYRTQKYQSHVLVAPFSLCYWYIFLNSF